MPCRHAPSHSRSPGIDGPCSPSRATEVSGNRQGRTWGSKGVHTRHCVPSDRRLGLSGFCTPRQGAFPPIRCRLRPPPPLSSPWPWLSVTAALQTDWGQRLTQQPHIRHGSNPLCPYKCRMVNHPKISLLECGFEFLQRWTRRPRGEITATTYGRSGLISSCIAALCAPCMNTDLNYSLNSVSSLNTDGSNAHSASVNKQIKSRSRKVSVTYKEPCCILPFTFDCWLTPPRSANHSRAASMSWQAGERRERLRPHVAFWKMPTHSACSSDEPFHARLCEHARRSRLSVGSSLSCPLSCFLTPFAASWSLCGRMSLGHFCFF